MMKYMPKYMSKYALILPGLLVALLSGANHAYAMGRKLDLNQVQGRYNYVATPDTALDCPESITVAYDANFDRLDSEIFHFTGIGRKVDRGGIDTDPDHAAYSDQWTETKLTSNSVVEKDVDETTTSDTSSLPILPSGPLDQSQQNTQLIDTSSVKTTRVTFDAKKKTLKKTVDIDGQSLNESCTYQKVD